MRLNCEDLNRIADVRVYVNDVLESSVYNNGRIYFPSRGISNRRIFLDCYGYAELSITLILVDGQEFIAGCHEKSLSGNKDERYSYHDRFKEALRSIYLQYLFTTPFFCCRTIQGIISYSGRED